ncbi:unnamed protein product [Dicrocoelium dendriticum]|nr:unnamed protein product [Dicrocoelium dendriticum]
MQLINPVITMSVHRPPIPIPLPRYPVPRTTPLQLAGRRPIHPQINPKIVRQHIRLLDLLKEVESTAVVSSSLSSCSTKPSSLNSVRLVPSFDGAAEPNTDNVDAETSDNLSSHRLQQLWVPDLRPSTYSSNGDDASTKSQSPTPTLPRSRPGRNHQDCSSSGMTLYSAAPTIVIHRMDRVPSVQQHSQSRPRSYSDLHQGMRYRHKLHRAHRIRSPSRADKLFRPACGFIETEKLTRELESSLFAQLVLSTDPPSSKEEAYSFPCKTDRTPIAPTVVPSACESPSTGSAATLTCVTPPRERVFEWLREADLFIAEHCREIPLGTLLSVAISPARTNLIELCTDLFSSQSSETVPPSAKRVTSKMWHQFLLLSLCEHSCVPTASVQSLVAESSVGKWRDGFDCRQPGKQKLLNALHSLAALEVEDPPSVDTYLLEELADFITTASSLNLSQDVYKSLRFCILAQNAFPHHFSTNYTEALAELQAQLPDAGDPWLMIQVLKLLNRLHCFDSGSLKLFFSLSSDRTYTSPESTGSTSLTAVPPPPACSFPQTHDTGAQLTFKRKAHPSTIANEEEDGGSDREMSPLGMRSRAYTMNSYHKSARLSALNASDSPTTRNRSDTVGHRTELRRKVPVS